MAGMMKPVLIAALLIAVVMPRGEAMISCRVVAGYLKPCVPYIMEKGPIGQCCDGIKRLHSRISSKVDQRTACGCLKSMGRFPRGIKYEKIAKLREECAVEAPYMAITPDIDCSKLK